MAKLLASLVRMESCSRPTYSEMRKEISASLNFWKAWIQSPENFDVAFFIIKLRVWMFSKNLVWTFSSIGQILKIVWFISDFMAEEKTSNSLSWLDLVSHHRRVSAMGFPPQEVAFVFPEVISLTIWILLGDVFINGLPEDDGVFLLIPSIFCSKHSSVYHPWLSGISQRNFSNRWHTYFLVVMAYLNSFLFHWGIPVWIAPIRLVCY